MIPSEIIIEAGSWNPVKFSPADFQTDLTSTYDPGRFETGSITEGLARVCELSYEPESDLNAPFNQLGFERVDHLSIGEMSCCFATINDSLVVAFRGTDAFGDILFDLDFRALEIGGGKVHRGFQDAYMVLQHDLLNKIRAINPKQLWIAGHSLGGAMAVLCGFDIVRNRKEPATGVVTFGQPLLCKADLADSIEEALGDRYVRFVNNRDLIARVPPNYVHCGQLIWWKNGKVFKNQKTGWRPDLLSYGSPAKSIPEIQPMDEREFEDFKAQVGEEKLLLPKEGRFFKTDFPFIEDHRMTSYLKQIRGR